MTDFNAFIDDSHHLHIEISIGCPFLVHCCYAATASGRAVAQIMMRQDLYSLHIQQIMRQVNEAFDLANRTAAGQLAGVLALQSHISEQLAEINRLNFSVGVPDIYAALKIDTSAITLAYKTSAEIIKLVQPLYEWRESYTQQIADIAKGFDSMTRRLVADFAAFRFSYQNIFLSGAFADFVRLITENKDLAEAFKEAGWPIAPSMPDFVRHRVIQLYKQGKARYASQSIIGYYSRSHHQNLRTTVAGWHKIPLFTSRMHIIEAALEAHCSGNYVLSIPAILPQIEGILNDYVYVNGLQVKLGRIEKVYAAVLGDIDQFDWPTWAITNTLLYVLQNSTYSFTSFEEQLAKSVRNRTTTRHTVLHGVAVRYDRQIDSLRAFLILDALTLLRNCESE